MENQYTGCVSTEGHEHCHSHSKPFCWSAVVAGTFVAIGIILLIKVFFMGLGLFGSPVGIGIGMIITAVVAFFIAGWVAGQLSAKCCCASGCLHGFVTWCLTLFLAIAVILPLMHNYGQMGANTMGGIWVKFIALLLGALAATFGGIAGVKKCCRVKQP